MPEKTDALDDIIPGQGENDTQNDETNKNTSETPQNDPNEGDDSENEENTQPTPPAPPKSEKQGNSNEPEPTPTLDSDPTLQVPLPTDPTNQKPVDQLDALNLSTDPAKSDCSKKPESGKIEVRVKELTYNEKGEQKYSPEEVMSVLALYDDFTNVRGYEKTRYQMEFEKLEANHRIADLKATKELLKRQGHEV